MTDGGTGALFNTNNNTAVANGASLNTLPYTTGQANPAGGLADIFNYIHIDGEQDTAGLTVAGAFSKAVAGGGITVNGGAAGHEFLVSFYDNTNSQAVFLTVNSGADKSDVSGSANLITSDDEGGIQVLALVGMSASDYGNLGLANIHFV